QSEIGTELECQDSTLKTQLSTAASEPVKTRPFDASRITDSESDVSFIDEPNVNLSPPGTVLDRCDECQNLRGSRRGRLVDRTGVGGAAGGRRAGAWRRCGRTGTAVRPRGGECAGYARPAARRARSVPALSWTGPSPRSDAAHPFRIPSAIS